MKGDLNIPNPDRRARRRILTLKNARFVVLGLVVVVVGLLLYERRRGTSAGDYGRLFGKQITQTQVEPQSPPDVITEAPVSDQSSPDRYVDVETRDQSLGVNRPPPHTTAQTPGGTASVAPVKPDSPSALSPAPTQSVSRVAVAGDDKGVSVAPMPRTAPKLTGGFGRPEGVPVTSPVPTTTHEDH